MVIELSVVGLNELEQQFELASFGKGHFELTATSELIGMSVLNASGRSMKPRIDLNSSVAKLDLSELSKGIYFVSITTEKGQSTLKLLR